MRSVEQEGREAEEKWGVEGRTVWRLMRRLMNNNTFGMTPKLNVGHAHKGFNVGRQECTLQL